MQTHGTAMYSWYILYPSYILGSTIDNENQDSGENEENQEESSDSNRSASPVPHAPISVCLTF